MSNFIEGILSEYSETAHGRSVVSDFPLFSFSMKTHFILSHLVFRLKTYLASVVMCAAWLALAISINSVGLIDADVTLPSLFLFIAIGIRWVFPYLLHVTFWHRYKRQLGACKT